MRATSNAAAELDRFGPTKVFDSYWYFAAERQNILFRRHAGLAPHWTDDPILQTYKFTNTYRATDRVSQYLINQVLAGPGETGEARNTLFRVLLFKLFNRIGTWELLREAFGEPAWDSFSVEAYGLLLDAARQRGQRIYSAAYIIPPVRAFADDSRKHMGHLALIDSMLRGDFVKDVRASRSLGELFSIYKSYPSLGPFLAYQLAIDTAYSSVVPHEESEFVVAGPGALDGISKCFRLARDVEPERIIALVCATQGEQFARRGIVFQTLFGRPLQLVDAQNVFCEISKYARVAHPEFAGRSGRTRIKQAFVAQPRLSPLELPPKWNLDIRSMTRLSAS